MPKKPNYEFEKRKKEQERERKAEQKRQDKLRRREAERALENPATSDTGAVDPRAVIGENQSKPGTGE